jgi:hypothetical protein
MICIDTVVNFGLPSGRAQGGGWGTSSLLTKEKGRRQQSELIDGDQVAIQAECCRPAKLSDNSFLVRCLTGFNADFTFHFRKVVVYANGDESCDFPARDFGQGLEPRERHLVDANGHYLDFQSHARSVWLVVCN